MVLHTLILRITHKGPPCARFHRFYQSAYIYLFSPCHCSQWHGVALPLVSQRTEQTHRSYHGRFSGQYSPTSVCSTVSRNVILRHECWMVTARNWVALPLTSIRYRDFSMRFTIASADIEFASIHKAVSESLFLRKPCLRKQLCQSLAGVISIDSGTLKIMIALPSWHIFTGLLSDRLGIDSAHILTITQHFMQCRDLNPYHYHLLDSNICQISRKGCYSFLTSGQIMLYRHDHITTNDISNIKSKYFLNPLNLTKISNRNASLQS